VPTALVIERGMSAGLKPGVIEFAEPMALKINSAATSSVQLVYYLSP